MEKNSAPLSRARVEARWRQADVARKLKINPQHLCRVERGQVGASDELLARIARLYGISNEQVTNFYRSARRQRLKDAVRRTRRPRGSRKAA